MANYKGMDVAAGLEAMIRHMGQVDEYRERLAALQAVWDNLTLLGQLAGAGADMTETRRAFGSLSVDLINQLAAETLGKVALEVGSKAQVAVDIMVRNLFERTADIGFLATDEDICAFAAAVQGDGDDDDRRQAIVARFREYARKYTVYRNILLVGIDGRVLAQLDDGNAVETSADPLLAEALSTGAAYVESFRHSDLEPAEATSLIYAFRVCTPASGKPLGVLCLCFRFENETERIFANLHSTGDWHIVALLDGDGRVIASSDEYQLPVGAPLPVDTAAAHRIVRFAGREFLAATRQTKGYQGYMGPGWLGHVMVPLDKAFLHDDADHLANVDDRVLAAVMSSTSLFSEALRGIPQQAERIQRELNRSVWNGNVRQSSDRRALNPAFSKILLWEISNTGLKTQDVFASSIGNLHETVVSSILGDSEFRAALAIDIMDRNLYERSDDCRWWALTTAFREELAAPRAGSDARITAILEYINGLYTVYELLVVFDAAGHVVAVSRPDRRELVGTLLTESWVEEVLDLKDSQAYAVSEFAPTPLYGGRATYVYGAAIRAPGERGRVVGGIGIVFDASPQFAAMLQDALPLGDAGMPVAGAFAVYAGRDRRVIASSAPSIAIGEPLAVSDAFVCLDNGGGRSDIIGFAGQYFAVGARMSAGYREYKGPADAYRNDVIALVFVPLGVASDFVPAAARSGTQMVQRSSLAHHDGEVTELATFHIGDEWFGLPSTGVVEAIDANAITCLRGMPECVRGVVMFEDNPVLVFDLRQHLQPGKPADSEAYRQIVIVRAETGEAFGILVHRLGEIPEVANDRIEPIGNIFPGQSILVESLVKPAAGAAGGDILVVLSAARIRRKLVEARSDAEILALATAAGR